MVDLNEKISDATTDVAKVLKTTGEVEFEQTYSRVIVDQIIDSAFVRVTHNWVAADSLRYPQTGLRVSDSRYWTVEGIFPQGFKARGKFNYSKTQTLDNTLITNPNDSLVILFRPDACYNWQPVPFTKQGGWMAGSLTVDTLLRGDYTLAAWDHNYLEQKEPASGNLFRVFPNPFHSQATVEFQLNRHSHLCLYDTAGKKLSDETYAAGFHKITLNRKSFPNGIYFLQLVDNEGNISESRKIVFE
jgi:hypothetical protein